MRCNRIWITLILVVELSGVLNAAQIRRNHRPWLMIGKRSQSAERSEPTPVKPKPDDPPVIASKPAKARTRPMPPRPTVRLRSESSPSGDRVAKQAMRYKGTRYRYGGTTKRGMDCSGLVARVYEDLKLKKIPRASAALYNSGTPVKLNELRPGDLVFFKNTYKRGISHVGVYAGHNKFVHAANRKRGVTVTAMSDPYYQLHYAGARRLY